MIEQMPLLLSATKERKATDPAFRTIAWLPRLPAPPRPTRPRSLRRCCLMARAASRRSQGFGARTTDLRHVFEGDAEASRAAASCIRRTAALRADSTSDREGLRSSPTTPIQAAMENRDGTVWDNSAVSMLSTGPALPLSPTKTTRTDSSWRLPEQWAGETIFLTTQTTSPSASTPPPGMAPPRLPVDSGSDFRDKTGTSWTRHRRLYRAEN